MATTLFFMVDIVQLEERLIVAQKVVSSSLTIHPFYMSVWSNGYDICLPSRG